MKNNFIRILLFVILLTIILICFGGKMLFGMSLNGPISNAAHYLQSSIDDSGRFVYIMRSDNLETSRRIYNIGRHAGTIYSMGLYEDLHKKDKTMQLLRWRAMNYITKNYLTEVGNDLYAVRTSPISNNDEKSNFAKIGSAAMTLTAFSRGYAEGKVSQDVITGLGNFIIKLQKPDGNFYSGYSIDTKSIVQKNAGRDALGQSALGLLSLNDVLPNIKWQDSAKLAVLAAAKKGVANNENAVFDYWSLIAADKLLHSKISLTSDEKSLIKAFAKQMAENAIAKQNLDKTSPYYGANTSNNRPNIVATYMEGMAAAYNIVDNSALKKQIRQYLIIGNKYLVKTQIKVKDKTFGGIPNTYTTEEVPLTKIRIDNVQHALSAWLMYKHI